MAKHKKLQRLIFKLSSKELRGGGWNLDIKLTDAETSGLLTPIAESTVIRWIDELNHAGDVDGKIRECISGIRELWKQESTNDTRTEMRRLYREKLRLMLVEDYANVVMDSNRDYKELCAHGFMLNGIKFVRLLSTTNGVKMKTVVFCSERLHPIIRFRLDNGRDLEKPMVPAKFGAYEALACSSSTPLSWPDGILVIPDCYTDFVEDVITIDDNESGEPTMKEKRGCKIHKDVSDGFGTMTPERAAIWSSELGIEQPVSGMNMRCAFLKGMLVPFDHVAFAEAHNGASPENEDGYMVRDIWGDIRDVRTCDVVFTESMLKLWASYKSLEDYLGNCRMNNYSLSTTKQAPLVLDPMWTTNYQFLQSYELSDDDINELVQPTIDNIRDILGGDYRKMLLYLCGRNITPNTFYNSDSGYVKALMINSHEVNDPYVRQSVSRLIRKRINQAKMGKLDVHGHFEIACGDPFSLWQSIFGLPVTGILKAGEIYSEFWQGSDDVLLFRSPMSVHNNIRKMHVCHADEARFWYRYIRTMVILNSWDTATDAMNGQDFDGDLDFITDNPVLLRNTKALPTIMCVQHSATKCRVEPHLLVEADMSGFGNKIGKITNDITSQFDILADVTPDSIEAEQLEYRIMCGQKFQQDSSFVESAFTVMCSKKKSIELLEWL